MSPAAATAGRGPEVQNQMPGMKDVKDEELTKAALNCKHAAEAAEQANKRESSARAKLKELMAAKKKEAYRDQEANVHVFITPVDRLYVRDYTD